MKAKAILVLLAVILSSGVVASDYDGHEYYLTSVGTWMQAEAEAVSMGGHLVSINDAAEQVFIHGLLSGSTWIGLTD